MTALDMVYRKGHDLDDRTIRHELEGKSLPLHGYHQHRQGNRPPAQSQCKSNDPLRAQARAM